MSKSKLCYDLRSVGQSGIKHPSGTYDQNFITGRELRVCWCGGRSLTRRRVCRLQLLLGLASTVIFGSESRGTRDHILLSDIRDFPFRRLLRLAGLRWRYSTPPPHGTRKSVVLTMGKLCPYNCSHISTWDQDLSVGDNRQIYNKNFDNVCTYRNLRQKRKWKLNPRNQIYEHQYLGFIWRFSCCQNIWYLTIPLSPFVCVCVCVWGGSELCTKIVQITH
jgi:hypothetical protein